MACDNSYSTEVAAGLTAGGIDNDIFWSLVKEAFPMMKSSHVDALLKRTSILVNTKSHLVVKLADLPGAIVYDIRMGETYLKQGAPFLLYKFYNGGETRDGDLQERLIPEEQALDKLFRGASPARPGTPMLACQWDPQTPFPSHHWASLTHIFV
eukprot:5867755-Amphidinium_carterae.1